MFHDIFVVAQAVVKCLVGMRAREATSKLRQVVPIVFFGLGRSLDGFEREAVEVFLRHLQRAVGPEEANRHKEGLIGGFIPLLDGPTGDLVVAHVFVRGVERVAVVPLVAAFLSRLHDDRHWRLVIYLTGVVGNVL